jgi:hypothetical protein
MFHTDFVSGPYGNMFLSVGRQHQGRQKVFLWELGSERPRGALSLAGDDVQAVALTQNGLAVATHDDKTIRLHKPSTGAVLASVTNDVAFTSFEMMPDEQSLVAGDAAGRVHWIQLGGQL